MGGAQTSTSLGNGAWQGFHNFFFLIFQITSFLLQQINIEYVKCELNVRFLYDWFYWVLLQDMEIQER